MWARDCGPCAAPNRGGALALSADRSTSAGLALSARSLDVASLNGLIAARKEDDQLPSSVGATDLDDRAALFSNHGSLVDIWAAGVGIVPADWQRPDGGLKMESGTSIAPKGRL